MDQKQQTTTETMTSSSISKKRKCVARDQPAEETKLNDSQTTINESPKKKLRTIIHSPDLVAAFDYFSYWHSGDLEDLTLEEFVKEWTCCKLHWSNKFPNSPRLTDTDFDSVLREVMRDRLLIRRGQPHRGCICASGIRGTYGVEDLIC